MYKIMIVEDNKSIRNELDLFLSKRGYQVSKLESFDNVVKDILEADVDLLLLDLTLPKVDGHYICQQIRKESSLPIIVVTSRDSSVDEIMSINYGADDFITKPYDLQILLARIEAITRRVYESEKDSSLKVKGLTLDLSKGVILYEDQQLVISKNEIFILTYLIQHKNTIVKREDLMKHLWGSEMYIDDNTLTVNINRIRNKLKDIGVSDLIETKRGMGYIISED